MLSISIDAPADTDFFEALNGFPVAADGVALGIEDDLLVLVGHFTVLLAQLLASGQRRTDGVAVSLGLEVVHVSSAAAEAQCFAFVPLFVEAPAQYGILARTLLHCLDIIII